MKTPIYYTIINKGNIIENTIFKSLPTAVSDFDHLDVMRYLPAHVDISEICLLAESKDIPEFKTLLISYSTNLKHIHLTLLMI